MKTSLLILYLIAVITDLTGQISGYEQDIITYRSDSWKGLIKDPRTTLLLRDSMYLDYFPIKEKNKVYAAVTVLENQQPLDMPTYAGLVKSFIKYATITFNWSGKKTTLTAYRNLQNMNNPLYKDHLFIPLKDQTTGRQTYAGGRYIDTRISHIQNGHMILDLNQIYNPWCAYSDGYNCPIPPVENHLPIKIKAGEKMYKKPH